MFWCFKRICNIAAQDREHLSQGVKDYYKGEEEMMYDKVMKANDKLLEKYDKSPAQTRTYATKLAAKMARTEKANTDKLFAKLITMSMHNSGVKFIPAEDFSLDGE